MFKKIDNHNIVYTGSYMDSLFVSHYLHRAGIDNKMRNSIKGSEKTVPHSSFPTRNVYVSSFDYGKAELLIKQFKNANKD